MENIVILSTWKGLLGKLILLLIIFWVLKLATYFGQRFAKKNVSNKKIINLLLKAQLYYKPIAITILVLGFISINYITHSVLLIFVSVFTFFYIKNYVSGIFFNANPLVSKGAYITIGDFKGEVKSLQAFGLIINTEYGERFINYTKIEDLGFAINSNVHTKLRQTLYLHSQLPKEQILNLIFDNPILDFDQKPSIKNSKIPQVYQFQYTLENGAVAEDLIAFLNENKIETSVTNNFN
ncbi:mechanosensitive ion channel domain-containing protein [Labilibaculum sp.]|uniref:mechanosensitive ion channel domain-containing protein n=1 Tax=Labilibaculum sp. TaxID=2060723 RepID=UPI003569108D